MHAAKHDTDVSGHDPPHAILMSEQGVCKRCRRELDADGNPPSAESARSTQLPLSAPLEPATSKASHEGLPPGNQDARSDTNTDAAPSDWRSKERNFRRKLGQILQSKRFHQILLILIVIDAAFVLTELFYTVLKPTCPPSMKEELPHWLEGLKHATLAIDCLFVLEIPLALYALGLRYYGLSWRKPPFQHAYLHLFDAVVILGTVILETALKGKEQELAGLLVVLRMWRVVKVVEGVAVGVGEWDEEQEVTLKEAKKKIKELQRDNEGLRRRLGRVGEEV